MLCLVEEVVLSGGRRVVLSRVCLHLHFITLCSLQMSLKTLSGLSLGSVSTSECDFLAKETLIEISPKFSHPKLKFISVGS